MPAQVPHGGGWGAQSWGGSGWGGPAGASAPLAFLGALAPAENVVRILLNAVPYYSGILDAYDASDPTHYVVTPLAGSQGYDGNPLRPVSTVQALISTQASNAIDVYLDRPMSPYPAQYVVFASNLATSSLSYTIGSSGSLQYYGVYRELVPQHEDVATSLRDLANPQTASAIQSQVLGSQVPVPALGVFNVDASGDYAFDSGIQSVKKRILRRGLTSPGAFAHLPSYGVGLMDAVKKLGTPRVQSKLAANYQRQILLEPEVVSASVVVVPDPGAPNLVHFVIKVQTRLGTTFSMDHPLDVVAGISLAAF